MRPFALQDSWPGVCCPTVPGSRAAKHLSSSKGPGQPSSWPWLCPANPRTLHEKAPPGGYSRGQRHRGVRLLILKRWFFLIGIGEAGENYARSLSEKCPKFQRIHGQPQIKDSNSHPCIKRIFQLHVPPGGWYQGQKSSGLRDHRWVISLSECLFSPREQLSTQSNYGSTEVVFA